MEKARQVFLRIIAIVMVAVLFVGIAPASSLAQLELSALAVQAEAADAVEVSSAKAPENYKPEKATRQKKSLAKTNDGYNLKKSDGKQKSSVETYASDNVDVLLIQDTLPWNSYANEVVLDNLGIPYHMAETGDLEYIDLWNYKMIIIANDQTFSTYQNFKAFKSRLDLFANLGGVILFGASDGGWANGEMSFDLPGGVQKVSEYAIKNYIVSRNHPIVSGKCSDKKALTNTELYSHYCSHGYFIESTLPAEANVILRSADSKMPTLVEYTYGSGHIIASTLTWEHNYVYGGTSDRFKKFSAKAMEDYFLYGYSLCQDNKVGEKMKITEDNNNFSHNTDSFFNWYESQKYHIDSDLFNKLISVYDADVLKWESIPEIVNLIQTRKSTKWGGSCFGISTSMALVHVGEVDLNNFDKDAKYYYDADMPKDNARFRSLINYYQLSQYLPILNKKVAMIDNEEYTHANMIQTIVSMAKESESTGYPFIFSFGYKWTEGGDSCSAGHAIVCVGCTEGTNNYRLEFVDPNKRDSYIYAKVPKDFSTITFESIYNASTQKSGGKDNWEITRVGYTTLTAFDAIDIDGPNNRYVVDNGNINKDIDYSDDAMMFDVMMVNSNSEFTMTNAYGETLSFDGADFSGDMPYAIVNFIENDGSSDYQLITYRSDSYEIAQARDTIGITIYNGDNEFYSFEGTGSEAISIDMDAGISATGTQMDCDVYCGVDEYALDMVSVSAEATDHISVTQDYSEMVVESDNLDNVEYKGYYGNNTQDIDNEAYRNGETDYLYKDEIHVHNYVVTRTECTCTDDGLVEYNCECGDYYTETIPALGMEHNISWVTVKPASVFAAGLQEQVCSNCKHVFQTKKIAQKKPATPKITSASRVAGGVKIKWSEVDGADSFYVYRKTKKSGWERIATVNGLSYSYTDKKAKTGTTYYYTVKAKNEAGTSGYNKKGIAIKYVAAPKIKSAVNEGSAIKVTWNKISGADGYYLYRKVAGASKSTKIATIKKGSTVSYKDKKAKAGVDYIYIVKAYDGKTVSGYYSDGYWVRRLTVPKLVSATSTSSGILVKWKQVPGAAGYIVYRKTGKGKWQNLGTIGSNYIGAYDNSTKKGKTYTYTVRAYYGNHKSAYNTKGLKVKDKH